MSCRGTRCPHICLCTSFVVWQEPLGSGLYVADVAELLEVEIESARGQHNKQIAAAQSTSSQTTGTTRQMTLRPATARAAPTTQRASTRHAAANVRETDSGPMQTRATRLPWAHFPEWKRQARAMRPRRQQQQGVRALCCQGPLVKAFPSRPWSAMQGHRGRCAPGTCPSDSATSAGQRS
jgi:hypothetical protein